MGLINNDSFTASNGVEKVGTYISFNNETIYLRKMLPPSSTYPSIPPGGQGFDPLVPYAINANYRIFWDKDAKDLGKSFIELRNVSVNISEEQLAGNLYVILYEELKRLYPNSQDELTITASSSVPSSSV